MQLDMGDVPAWLQVVGGGAQLTQAIWAQHTQRAAHFRGELLDASGRTIDELAEMVVASPELGDLLLAAIEASMRSASAKKREVLARVTAEAFTDSNIDLDEIAVLQRTATLVEEADMRVLTEVALVHPDNYPDADPGCAVWADLTAHLPPGQNDEMLAPILSHLVGLAVLIDGAQGTWDHVSKWRVSSYGFRFLQYLPIDRSRFDSATVVAFWSYTTLTVRNLGWGTAMVRSVHASWDDHPMRTDFPTMFRLQAGESMDIAVNDEVPRGSGVRMTVEWADPTGDVQRFERIKFKS